MFVILRTELDLDAEAPPSKKARVDEDTDFSMASLARGEITQVRNWGWGNRGGERRGGEGGSAGMMTAIDEIINDNLISSHSGWHLGPSLRLPHSDWQEGHG